MNFKNAIFDMDGTLWDAVDSYAKIWNITAREFGIAKIITRQDLIGLMGITIDRIFRALYPDGNVDPKKFLPVLDKYERELMPILGGKLYPGVREGIEEISSSLNLYMVSNCGKDGLTNFLEFTGLKPFFKDTLTYGETGYDKAANISEIIGRHKMVEAVYIGDTESDCRAAHEAGIPMIHAKYGFGIAPDAEFSAGNFREITEILLQ